ncbi:MAG: cyclase family protein [Anaerolineae bacterium]|nr:cyclase family protein [Anaerolineae bacterium]
MLDTRRMLYLSFPLSPDGPVPPAITPMQITPRYQLSAGDDANVYRVSFDNHSGTHADAPAHVIANGLRITDLSLADFTFARPAVVDLPLPDTTIITPDHLQPHLRRMQGADIVLFRLGYGPVRRAEPQRYLAQCPGFGVAGAEYLRRELPALRAVGMDVPSFVCIEYLGETMRAHNVMLGGEGRRFLLVEDMDLEKDLTSLSELLVVPWLMAGVDSAPCTVLGILAA